MRISHRFEKNVCIILFEDNLAFDGVTVAKSYIMPILDKPNVHGIILNLDGAQNLDSSGIALIMAIYKHFQNSAEGDGTLKHFAENFALCCLHKSILKILRTIQLDMVLPIYPTEEEAFAIVSGAGPLVSHYIHDDICVIALEKNLVLKRVVEVEDFINSLLKNPDIYGMVLNFNGVEDIDSTGIGFMMGLYSSLQKRGSKNRETKLPPLFAVSNLNKGIKKVFSMLSLNQALDIYASEADAIQALEEKMKTIAPPS